MIDHSWEFLIDSTHWTITRVMGKSRKHKLGRSLWAISKLCQSLITKQGPTAALVEDQITVHSLTSPWTEEVPTKNPNPAPKSAPSSSSELWSCPHEQAKSLLESLMVRQRFRCLDTTRRATFGGVRQRHAVDPFGSEKSQIWPEVQKSKDNYMKSLQTEAWLKCKRDKQMLYSDLSEDITTNTHRAD